MKLEFGYGRGVQTVTVPDENVLAVLESNPMEHARCGEEAVRWAMEHPIGSAPLRKLVQPGQKIAIVTSDFHTIRAAAIAKHQGYQRPILLASPTPLSIRYNAWFREYFAFVSGWLFGEY